MRLSFFPAHIRFFHVVLFDTVLVDLCCKLIWCQTEQNSRGTKVNRDIINRTDAATPSNQHKQHTQTWRGRGEEGFLPESYNKWTFFTCSTFLIFKFTPHGGKKKKNSICLITETGIPNQLDSSPGSYLLF